MNADGTAAIPIVTGGSDQNATDIAVFLIPSNTTPPVVLGGPLPAPPGAAASLQVSRTQASISGAIRDLYGNAISGAVISDANLGQTTSEANGKYSFYNIPASGTATLTVNHPNYVCPASPVALTIAAGNQVVNFTCSAVYLVGDVYPYAANAAPEFGDQALDIRDLVQELFAVTKVPGFVPASCSDRFDAMDLYPVDTETARGGDGNLDIRDLVRLLFRVTKLDSAMPVRASLGGACAGATQRMPAVETTQEMTRRLPAGFEGALMLGAPQAVSEGVERAAIYLEARRDLSRVAVAFALGDRISELRFVTAETKTTFASASEPGVVAVVWTEGVNVAAGQRILLGYMEGPAGTSANWRLFGVSASGLDDDREVNLSAGRAGVAQ